MTNIIIKSKELNLDYLFNKRDLENQHDLDSISCYFFNELEREGIEDIYEIDFDIIGDGLLNGIRKRGTSKFTIEFIDEENILIPKEILCKIFPLAHFK